METTRLDSWMEEGDDEVGWRKETAKIDAREWEGMTIRVENFLGGNPLKFSFHLGKFANDAVCTTCLILAVCSINMRRGGLSFNSL